MHFAIAEAIRHNEQLLESIGVVSDSAHGRLSAWSKP